MLVTILRQQLTGGAADDAGSGLAGVAEDAGFLDFSSPAGAGTKAFGQADRTAI